MNKNLCLFFAIAVLFFVFNGISYAGLSVFPSVTNVHNTPGSIYEGSYDIKNSYDSDIYIVINVTKGNCFSGNKNIDFEKILVFEENRYFIPAGETITVPYKLYVKKNFKGSVSVKAEFKVEKEHEQSITLLVSVPIYVIVSGTENIDFGINSIDLVNSDYNKRICYNLSLTNKGNVHIRHSGDIEIYTKKKRQLIRNLKINETVPTYCESNRDFVEMLLPYGELGKGKYIAVFKVRALGKEVEKEVKFKILKNGKVQAKSRKVKK